jgi:nicotinate dehydrogenase subunit A
MATYRLVVNGVAHRVRSWDPDQPLLYVLRNALGLRAAKFGCGVGQCGSCTVLIDGKPARACLTPVSAAVGKHITTLEGLGSQEKPHPVQAAFIAEQAAQCGYCTSGIVMSAVALLESKAHPTREEIEDALADNLCRCGSHDRVLRAVERAAATTERRKPK